MSINENEYLPETGNGIGLTWAQHSPVRAHLDRFLLVPTVMYFGWYTICRFYKRNIRRRIDNKEPSSGSLMVEIASPGKPVPTGMCPTHLKTGTGNPVISQTATAVVLSVISLIKLPSNLRPGCLGGMLATGSVRRIIRQGVMINHQTWIGTPWKLRHTDCDW